MRKLWLIMTVMAMGCATMMNSCTQHQASTSNETSIQATDSTVADTVATGEKDFVNLVEKYLVDSIAPQYLKGEISIPVSQLVDIDDSNINDVKMWGSFWVFNYNVSGDTLKTVSGGNHSGLFHLNIAGNAAQVTSFEQVGDGSEFLPTAKKIFGDKFETYSKVSSDDKKRDSVRTQAIEQYVKEHNLKVTMYQDYGWPPVKLTK